MKARSRDKGCGPNPPTRIHDHRKIVILDTNSSLNGKGTSYESLPTDSSAS